MLTSRSKKENVIVLPNRDRLPVGRMKDVSKMMSVMSAEYGIEADIGYFTVEKEKAGYALRLLFVPTGVAAVRTVNAKKFMIYELARLGQGCSMVSDEDLNKRVAVITNLLDTIEDSCRETITSKLSGILDLPGQLDLFLDQLLTDPQFNCFKYATMNDAKKTCMFCVNGDGLFVRAPEVPFEVSRRLSWQDIADIKAKANKLVFRKKSGEVEVMVLINRRTASMVQAHLVKYLAFVGGNNDLGERTRAKGSWFGSFAQKIRQSFSKRSRTHDPEGGSSTHPPTGKTAPPNSVVPDSSVVSEDGLDNLGSLVEPSIKTNSTHDVSLGSAHSFLPGASYEQPQQPQNHSSFSRDDRMSVKTTSTYEVSLDSGTSPRTVSVTSRGDHDSSGPALMSFGQVKKSPPLSPGRGVEEEVVVPSVVRPVTKIVPVPPPVVPTRTPDVQPPLQAGRVPPMPPVRSPDLQAGDPKQISPVHEYPGFSTTGSARGDAVLSAPPRPVEVHSEPSAVIVHSEIAPLKADKLERPTLPTIEEPIQLKEVMACGLLTYTEEMVAARGFPPSETYSYSPTGKDTAATAAIIAEAPKTDEQKIPALLDVEEPIQKKEVMACGLLENAQKPGLRKVVEEDVIQTEVVPQKFDQPPAVRTSPTKEDAPEKDLPKKVECKLPVSQKKSIPSPRVQRPSRIPSVSPSKEDALPKPQSPSDKENYDRSHRKSSSTDKYPDFDEPPDSRSTNFSRFSEEECTVDSRTTVTSVSAVGDSIVKKSVKTEVSSVRSSGIQAPKTYKTTTTVTSTVKKPVEAPRSPVMGVPRASGIPRMASK